MLRHSMASIGQPESSQALHSRIPPTLPVSETTPTGLGVSSSEGKPRRARNRRGRGKNDYDELSSHQPNLKRVHRPQEVCNRTITLGNLLEDTSPWDITSAIRGGSLLQITMGQTQRAQYFCNVSFVMGQDAEKFLQHAKKNGIFVKGKKVS